MYVAQGAHAIVEKRKPLICTLTSIPAQGAQIEGVSAGRSCVCSAGRSCVCSAGRSCACVCIAQGAHVHVYVAQGAHAWARIAQGAHACVCGAAHYICFRAEPFSLTGRPPAPGNGSHGRRAASGHIYIYICKHTHVALCAHDQRLALISMHVPPPSALRSSVARSLYSMHPLYCAGHRRPVAHRPRSAHADRAAASCGTTCAGASSSS